MNDNSARASSLSNKFAGITKCQRNKMELSSSLKNDDDELSDLCDGSFDVESSVSSKKLFAKTIR